MQLRQQLSSGLHARPAIGVLEGDENRELCDLVLRQSRGRQLERLPAAPPEEVALGRQCERDVFTTRHLPTGKARASARAEDEQRCVTCVTTVDLSAETRRGLAVALTTLSLPTPSAPLSFRPHAYTSPSFVNASRCAPPNASCFSFLSLSACNCHE